ncbi:MAG: tRNA (adenosine(37)-N6)-threonylcarbamoyltransferase complex ATPase subunit type 1 TsaE [Ignavibacteria bacterium]
MESLISNSVEETRKFGREFAKRLDEKDIVAIYGELGSGKTQIIKGICSRLGVKQVVNSPTFIIINEYSSEKIPKIFHFDLYRLNSINEITNIGLFDYFNEAGLILIEWPKLIEYILPDKTKKISISHISDETSREIRYNG